MTPATAERTWQVIEWLGMAFSVPADWEIVRHSVKPEAGRLTFVDRRAQRLQIGWAAARAAPAIDRMMEDYKVRDQEEDPAYRFRHVERGCWRGYRRVGGAVPLTRAGAYDERGGRWIELTIPWHERYDASLERSLLERFELTEHPARARRWSAFGMSAEAPDGWPLVAARVWPGQTELRFRRGKSEAQLRRLKSPRDWFDGNLVLLLRRQIKSLDARVISEGDGTTEGRTARLESWEDVAPIRRWVGMQRRRLDAAWLEPGGQAVCQVSTLAPPRHRADPGEFSLGPQAAEEAA